MLGCLWCHWTLCTNKNNFSGLSRCINVSVSFTFIFPLLHLSRFPDNHLDSPPLRTRGWTNRRLLECFWTISSWSILAVSWRISASSSFCVWSTCWQSRAKVVAISLATKRAQSHIAYLCSPATEGEGWVEQGSVCVCKLGTLWALSKYHFQK